MHHFFSLASHWLSKYALALLLFALFVLYLATLDNGLQPEELRGGDLITHQYAQVQARPSNAPGYPLYTMGGWIWFHSLRTIWHWFGVPSPNPLPLLSSYSLFWALLALWLFYRCLSEIQTRPSRYAYLVTLLLTAFYAVTYFFWYYATTIEQYSSAIAQTLAIVFLYFRWQTTEDKVPDADSASRRKPYFLLYGMAFLCGLSLAHMLTVALIVPPLVLVILWQRPTLLRQARVVAMAIVAATAPLLSYLYVYWRGATHPEWWGRGDWQTPAQWFWSFVSTAQGREELSWGLEAGWTLTGVGFPQLIWQELGIPLLVIGLIGIALLGQRRAVLLYATLIFYLIFCWLYRFGNWYQVILPAYPLVLLGVAAVAGWLGEGDSTFREGTAPSGKVQFLPGRFVARPKPRVTQSIMVIFLLSLLIWRISASWPQVNSRNRAEDRALDRAAILLDQPLPPGANLYAAYDDVLALQYLIDIWQLRPDLRPDLHTVDSQQASQLLTAATPVVATWDVLALLRTELDPAVVYHLQSLSPDWVQLTPLSHPALVTPTRPLRIPITDTVTFLGFSFAPSPSGQPVQQAEPGVDVTLFWQIEGGVWPAGLSISVRPTKGGAWLPLPGDSTGAIVQQDRPAPMQGLLADGQIQTREIIADAYRLTLSAPVPDGADAVKVILYRATEKGFEQVKEFEVLLSTSPK